MSGPKAIAGVHLVKTEDTAQADDIRDIVHAEQQGRILDPHATQREQEEERKGEAYFFEAVARRIDERLTWAASKLRVVELGERDGYLMRLSDREGRPYEIQVLYDDLVEIALAQRAWETERGPTVMADLICDKLTEARRKYFERMFGPSITS